MRRQSAREDSPLAWLRFEPERGADEHGAFRYLIDLTVWPGWTRTVLGEADPHGRWIDWRV